jgi:hypothetical protein
MKVKIVLANQERMDKAIYKVHKPVVYWKITPHLRDNAQTCPPVQKNMTVNVPRQIPVAAVKSRNPSRKIEREYYRYIVAHPGYFSCRVKLAKALGNYLLTCQEGTLHNLVPILADL